MILSIDSKSAVRCDDIPSEPVWRFTVDEYHEIVRAGILPSGTPVELLEGWLIKKIIKNPAHRVATRKTRIALENVVGEGWSVDTQESITTRDSEPEPDVSVVRVDTSQLLDRHPIPTEVGMLVEVADSSLDRDRGSKKRIYASANIAVYWIVNLVDHCVELYSQPSGPCEQPDYTSLQVFKPDESIPVHLDGIEITRIAVDDLLP